MSYELLKLTYDKTEYIINKEFKKIIDLKQIKLDFKNEHNLNEHPLHATYKCLIKTKD